MSVSEKSRILDSVLNASKWFEIDLTIKLFGVVIWSYHYPPQKS